MSVFLRKTGGGASIGEYVWAKAGDVVEVTDEFAASVLRIVGHDFEQVTAPKTTATKGKPAPFSD